jgi:dCMP deaminase
MRPDKTTYYFEIARLVGERSPCTRRKLGAVLIRDDSFISTGYNGSIRGGLNCGIDIKCLKEIHNIPALTKPETDLCSAIHAEENAIINCARIGISTVGATLYLAPFEGKSQRPCSRCRKMIIQAGIKDCWYIDLDGSRKHEEVSTWIELENQWMKEMEGKQIAFLNRGRNTKKSSSAYIELIGETN